MLVQFFPFFFHKIKQIAMDFKPENHTDNI